MLAENLKKARKNSGYSQDEVATKLSITRQSISKWETGRAYPDVISLKLLCDLYDISMDEIIKDDEIIQKKKKEIIQEKEEVESPNKESKNEIMFMIIITIVACTIPSLGIAVSIFVIVQILRKKKEYSLGVKLIIIFCLILSITNLFVILNNMYFHIGEVTIS